MSADSAITLGFVDIYNALKSLGRNCAIPEDWYGRIDSWERWYQGRTSFHQYKVYNGNRFVSHKKYALSMAKTLCEDRADILLNEHTDIMVSEDAAQDYLDDVFERTDFWTQANQLIERVGWSGTGAIVLCSNGDIPDMEFVDATSIFPLAWRNNKISACAFASVYVDSSLGALLYITIHEPAVDGIYKVKNYLFNQSGEPVDLPPDVPQEWSSGMTYPTFHIVRLSMINNFDKNNPMGIALYANAIDVLKTLDTAFDSLAHEFILGRKRIFVDSGMVNIDLDTGERVPIFDPNDLVFHGIPGLRGSEEKQLPIREVNMDLRTDQHIDTIQANLDLLSVKTGFGRGFYKFEAMQATTATEVVSTDSKLYRRMRKDEIILENVLIFLTRALLFLGGFNAQQEISVHFDDSVIEDTNARAQRALQELAQGAISLEQYNEQVLSMREEAAAKRARKTRQQLRADKKVTTETAFIGEEPKTDDQRPER